MIIGYICCMIYFMSSWWKRISSFSLINTTEENVDLHLILIMYYWRHWQYFFVFCFYLFAFFQMYTVFLIRPQCQSRFHWNFPKLSEKFHLPKFWIFFYWFVKLFFDYIMIVCSLFLQLREQYLFVVIHVHYLKTLNTLFSNCMIYWNDKFPKILVLSLIFPILRAPAPVPKFWKKTTLKVDCCSNQFSETI